MTEGAPIGLLKVQDGHCSVHCVVKEEEPGAQGECLEWLKGNERVVAGLGYLNHVGQIRLQSLSRATGQSIGASEVPRENGPGQADLWPVKEQTEHLLRHHACLRLPRQLECGAAAGWSWDDCDNTCELLGKVDGIGAVKISQVDFVSIETFEERQELVQRDRVLGLCAEECDHIFAEATESLVLG
jgi:hypothetical protein